MVRRDGLRAGVCVAVIVMAMVATGVAWGAGTQEEVYGTDFEGLTLGRWGGIRGMQGRTIGMALRGRRRFRMQ